MCNLKDKNQFFYISVFSYLNFFSVCYVRSVTLEMAITLLEKLTIHEKKAFISDKHIAVILNAKEKILPLLRQYFKVNIVRIIVQVIH